MSANIDPLNIPHFVGGSVGNLDYSHINQLVDRVNTLSSFLTPDLVSAVGVLRQNANQNTQQRVITARITNRVTDAPASDINFYQWEEVVLDLASGQFEKLDNGRTSRSGNYAVCVNVPTGLHSEKIVQLRSSATLGAVDDEYRHLMYFTSNSSTDLQMAKLTLSSSSGNLGDSYNAQPTYPPGYEEEYEGTIENLAYNVVEMSIDPLLGSEIDAENCETNPVPEAIRLPSQTRVLGHLWQEEELEIEGSDDQFYLKRTWYFNLHPPVSVDCNCPEGTQERSGYAGTFEQQMITGD
tara:strand:- start:635 stop:1522 length:888 start_codon:yes stop_codon:yes gene_type:complete